MNKSIKHFIGDVHGRFSEYANIISGLPSSVQLGDMGLGFGKDNQFISSPRHYFIRGNHDDPEVCKKQKNYLGDFGVTEDGYFFLSGAESVDRYLRTEGVDWWRDEELSASAFNAAFCLYRDEKPKLVFTHTCPSLIMGAVLGTRPRKIASTSRMLSAFFNEHQPETWIFAHMHVDMEFDWNNTHFVALGECSVYELCRGFISPKFDKENNGG
jgi:hypothetical protein